MRILISVALSLLATLTTHAHNIHWPPAGIHGSWYFASSASFDKFGGADVDSILTASDFTEVENLRTAKARYKDTFGGHVAAGFLYKDFPGWSTEIEGQFRGNPTPKAINQTATVTNAGLTTTTVASAVVEKFAHIPKAAVMLNAYYEHPIWRQFKVSIGAGVGVALKDLTYRLTTTATTGLSNTVVTEDKNETRVLFAFQAMARGIIPLTKKIDLFAGYRLVSGTKKKEILETIEIGSATTQLSLNCLEYPLIHSAEAGIRIKI